MLVQCALPLADLCICKNSPQHWGIRCHWCSAYLLVGDAYDLIKSDPRRADSGPLHPAQRFSQDWAFEFLRCIIPFSHIDRHARFDDLSICHHHCVDASVNARPIQRLCDWLVKKRPPAR